MSNKPAAPSRDEAKTARVILDESYLASSLGMMARDLHRAINRAIDERVGHLGLTSYTCRYLALIRELGQATPKELSDYLSVKSPTTVAALRLLESKLLIARSQGVNDARQTFYCLTESGMEVERTVRQGALEVEAMTLEALDASEIRQLRKIVGRLRASLGTALSAAARSAGPSESR